MSDPEAEGGPRVPEKPVAAQKTTVAQAREATGDDAPSAETGADPEVAAQTVAPRERGRLAGIDVARGFALLGIFLVNVDFFALPIGVVPYAERSGAADLISHSFMKTFAEGKFYPLFSMLFGMGLILQMRSVEGRGGAFVPLYLRRLAVLSVIGLCHGLFLWYGDILFVYSLVAVLLLLLRNLSGKLLLGGGVTLWLVASLVMGGFGAFGSFSANDELPNRGEILAEAEQIEIEGAPFASTLQLFLEEGGGEELTESSRWVAAEVQAYRNGGYLDQLGFRGLTFGIIVAVFLFGGALDIPAMFLIGAGLLKLGLFERENERWLMGMLGAAMVLGLPLSALSVVALDLFGGGLGGFLQMNLRVLGGPVLAGGYLAAAVLLARSGAVPMLRNALAAAGRMALTNYLSQTLIASFVFYHWGLGLFASMPAVDRVWLVCGVYAGQLVLSLWWMGRFRFGPVEWLWRSLTYWQRQPMRR